MSIYLHLCLYHTLFASSPLAAVCHNCSNDLHPIVDKVGSTTQKVPESRSPLSAIAHLHRTACQGYLCSTR